MDAVVSKPVEARALLAALQQVMAHHQGAIS